MALSARQARFVAEYLIDSNATQAAIRAGYSAATAKQIGSRLLTYADVAQAVAAGRAKLADRAEMTVQSHLDELAALRDKAKTEGQLSAAISAEVSRGKVAGFYVDRTEDVTGLTREQRRQRLLRLVG